MTAERGMWSHILLTDIEQEYLGSQRLGRRMLSKLHLHNRGELVRYAIEHGQDSGTS